jgi:hypothetical protein
MMSPKPACFLRFAKQCLFKNMTVYVKTTVPASMKVLKRDCWDQNLDYGSCHQRGSMMHQGIGES